MHHSFRHGKLIGRGGENKKRLQRETQATIVMPPRGQQGKVVVNGKTQGAVVSCRTKIETLINDAVKAMPMTHFVSIPLSGTEFEHSLEQFREQALEQQKKDGGLGGLTADLFQGHAKLHLTLGALKLFDDDVPAAKACLLGCKAGIQKHLPATIVVKGVDYMSDNPTEMDVLFAKVDFDGAGAGGLQEVADYVALQFVDAGLLEHSGRNHVKLHATIINTKWRRGSVGSSAGGGGGGGGGGRAPPGFRAKRIPFDGSKLLTKFARFNFGSAAFETVHLSKMKPSRAGKPTADGYYEPECVLAL